MEKIPYFYILEVMYSIKINNNEFPVKIKLFRNIPILYENDIPHSESTKIDINSNNKIEIMKDNKKFDENLKNKPELAQQLSASPKCSADTEKKDCGSCVPNRVFTV